MPSATPGWYGKLPTLGDFASRRLDPAWTEAWDHWLASGLQDLRAAAPDTWLNNYLASPAWRFALLPGVLPAPVAQEWRVGVLVPSVDRVGRYFPLVVVSQPLPVPAGLHAAMALWQWASQLEDLAVAALQQDWSAEALDEALARLSPAPAWACSAASSPFEQGLSALCQLAAWQGLQGRSLWCHSALDAPLLHPGLPTGQSLHRLFTPC